jgi:hypothetical protein
MIQIFQILLMSLYIYTQKNHLKLRRESIDIKSQIYVIRNGSIRNVDLIKIYKDTLKHKKELYLKIVTLASLSFQMVRNCVVFCIR